LRAVHVPLVHLELHAAIHAVGETLAQVRREAVRDAAIRIVPPDDEVGGQAETQRVAPRGRKARLAGAARVEQQRDVRAALAAVEHRRERMRGNVQHRPPPRRARDRALDGVPIRAIVPLDELGPLVG